MFQVYSSCIPSGLFPTLQLTYIGVFLMLFQLEMESVGMQYTAVKINYVPHNNMD